MVRGAAACPEAAPRDQVARRRWQGAGGRGRSGSKAQSQCALAPPHAPLRSPPLPAGLRLDPRTGAIAGTAEVASSPRVYTVRRSAAGASHSVEIGVVPPQRPPRFCDPSYERSPAVYGRGLPAAANSPNIDVTEGGPVDAFAAEGLPPGLYIDTVTGDIFGTPERVGNTQVRVTATNSAGGATCLIDVEVGVLGEAAREWLGETASANVNRAAALSRGAQGLVGVKALGSEWQENANAAAEALRTGSFDFLQERDAKARSGYSGACWPSLAQGCPALGRFLPLPGQASL